MARRRAPRQLTQREIALVAELRQIEAEHHAAEEAERAAFREEAAENVRCAVERHNATPEHRAWREERGL